MAGGAEAGDCYGNVCAGLVGLDSGAAIRREREPGFQLAEALSRRPSSAAASSPQLIPVMITGEQDAVAAPPSTVAENIEIDVAGKYRVQVGNSFDGKALRRVLDVLERR
jgi:predicted lipoprotein